MRTEFRTPEFDAQGMKYNRNSPARWIRKVQILAPQVNPAWPHPNASNDVLEHIEDDAKELDLASQHLLPDGFLIVLSPAYQWLYSEFDSSIGHFRRYERASLLSLTPQECVVERICYLDSVSVLTSLANRIFLKQAIPTAKQIDFWDSVLIPVSRIINPLTNFSIGRSIVSVWSKDAN